MILSASKSFVRVLPKLLKNDLIFTWSQSITDFVRSNLPLIVVSPNNCACPCDINVFVLSKIKLSEILKFAFRFTLASIVRLFSNLVFLWNVIFSDDALLGNVAIKLLLLVISLF